MTWRERNHQFRKGESRSTIVYMIYVDREYWLEMLSPTMLTEHQYMMEQLLSVEGKPVMGENMS